MRRFQEHATTGADFALGLLHAFFTEQREGT